MVCDQQNLRVRRGASYHVAILSDIFAREYNEPTRSLYSTSAIATRFISTQTVLYSSFLISNQISVVQIRVHLYSGCSKKECRYHWKVATKTRSRQIYELYIATLRCLSIPKHWLTFLTIINLLTRTSWSTCSLHARWSHYFLERNRKGYHPKSPYPTHKL